MIEIGLKHTSELTVTDTVTAIEMGSGDMPVLATPAMMALMENAAMLAVADELPEGCTTVGGHIQSSHLKPSKIGDKVSATAEVTKVFTLLVGLTMLAVYHAGLYNRGIIEDNTIASQKEIIERDKNLIDYLQGHIGFLEDYIKEIKSTKTKK